ncbi:hypothetical protein [Paenibacillus kobensis]|uniref:hypothetical protein n=1 Tax=Paenibacillus kobensis TaxID=59841 RepID=UPI000FD935C7|nr:hypothetical protein [Paenibacillus kobensis]
MIRGFMLWPVFAVMFVCAVWSLELIEGNKITTTEYYGLRNLGGGFLYYFFIIAAFLYPIAVLPLMFILHRWVRFAWLRTVLYTSLGVFVGWRIFRFLYEQFVSQYELNASSALIIFGLLGLLYGILDAFMAKKEARFKPA